MSLLTLITDIIIIGNSINNVTNTIIYFENGLKLYIPNDNTLNIRLLL